MHEHEPISALMQGSQVRKMRHEKIINKCQMMHKCQLSSTDSNMLYELRKEKSCSPCVQMESGEMSGRGTALVGMGEPGFLQCGTYIGKSWEIKAGNVSSWKVWNARMRNLDLIGNLLYKGGRGR